MAELIQHPHIITTSKTKPFRLRMNMRWMVLIMAGVVFGLGSSQAATNMSQSSRGGHCGPSPARKCRKAMPP